MAICLLFFPLLLRLAFVLPGIAAGTQGLVECVCCVGGACYKISFPSVGYVHFFCCTITAIEKCPSTPQDNWEQHHVMYLCSKQIAQFCVLLVLLRGLVHIPSVRIAQLNDPYLPGCDLHYPAVWAKLCLMCEQDRTLD